MLLFLLLLTLVTLGAAPSVSPAFAESLLPATGQKKCWDASGARVTCTGTGQDGDQRAGLGIRIVDNGMGVLADANTRLVWEKLSRDASVHRVTDVYGWEQAIAVKIAQLNTPPCFAGLCTWRLPNVKELQSLADFDRRSPAFGPAFDRKCKKGCKVGKCSCTPMPTVASGFWSSTTNQALPAEAWQVLHETGATASFAKTALASVRAVAEPVCRSAVATVQVSFAGGVTAASGVTTVVDYPGDLADVPGCCNDPSVLARVTNLTGQNGLFTAGDNDLDGDGLDDQIGVGLVALGGPGISPGAFASIRFDCTDPMAPLVTDFQCLLDASDENGGAIAGTCSVALRYE